MGRAVRADDLPEHAAPPVGTIRPESRIRDPLDGELTLECLWNSASDRTVWLGYELNRRRGDEAGGFRTSVRRTVPPAEVRHMSRRNAARVCAIDPQFRDDRIRDDEPAGYRRGRVRRCYGCQSRVAAATPAAKRCRRTFAQAKKEARWAADDSRATAVRELALRQARVRAPPPDPSTADLAANPRNPSGTLSGDLEPAVAISIDHPEARRRSSTASSPTARWFG